MAKKIMIIRHAEKPEKHVAGVTASGDQDDEDLTVRGWQRAGALVRYFAPAAGVLTDKRIATPAVIFASGAGKRSKSLRPEHTVAPLAEVLGQALVLTHLKGEEDALVKDVLGRDGPVLICWQHELIPGIVNRSVGNDTTAPQNWPDDRFDVAWVLDASNGEWKFAQAPQLLLAGDVESGIES